MDDFLACFVNEINQFIHKAYLKLLRFGVFIFAFRHVDISYGLTIFRKKLVFYRIVSSKTNKPYLPAINLEIYAHLFPTSPCSLISFYSSYLLHSSLFIFGSK
jgi:hypothetical protein